MSRVGSAIQCSHCFKLLLFYLCFCLISWHSAAPLKPPRVNHLKARGSCSFAVRNWTPFALLTHSVSGVAEDSPRWLVDCHIQYSGAVAQQGCHRLWGHRASPQSDCSVAPAAHHQLQSGVVAKTFHFLHRDNKALDFSFADSHRHEFRDNKEWWRGGKTCPIRKQLVWFIEWRSC